MPKHIDIYTIPTAIDKSVAEVITDQLASYNLEPALVDVDKYMPEIRKSKVLWIPTDNWISGMLAHFIHVSNADVFQYDLTEWSERVQYTVYDGAGSNYKWHTDYNKSAFIPNHVRKLSISLCLSSKNDYEGGELQILLGPEMKTFKMDIGDAVIFPSDCVHRVRPLKSGKRISLVGWMGGPKFK